MNNFKRNIYRTATEVAVIPPEYYQLDVLEGSVVCNAGVVAFENPNPVTLYTNTIPLVTGTALYTNTELTNLSPYDGIRQGTDVYVLIGGVIDLVTVIGNPC